MASAMQRSGRLILADKNSKFQAQFVFDEPAVHTLQFNVDLTDQSYKLGGVWPSLVADIAWSVSGGVVRRLVSIVNGMSISGASDSVEVSIADQGDSYPATPDGRVQSEHSEVLVTVQAAKGARNGGLPASLRQGYYSLAYDQNGESEEFRIDAPPSLQNHSELIYVPQNVGAVSAEITVQTADGTATAASISQLILMGTNDPNPLNNERAIKRYDPNRQTGFVQLAPGVVALRIFNYSASSVYYSTTWGIDG